MNSVNIQRIRSGQVRSHVENTIWFGQGIREKATDFSIMITVLCLYQYYMYFDIYAKHQTKSGK